MEIDRTTVLAERLRRQRLTDPLGTPDGYIELFRLLQPVSPITYSRPGDPPRLVHRTRFDDGAIANRLRARRTLVKGRFLGGKIGYVLANDLALYANAFRRPLPILNERQRIVLDVVQDMGPLTPRQVKEETDLLNKYIMPALHRLQSAFLVYEDQTDEDWERGWYDFGMEWPDIELDERRWQPSAMRVLTRFLQGHVYATFEQIKDWSQLPRRSLTKLIHEMENARLIVPQVVEGLGTGWVLAQDVATHGIEIQPSVYMLHKADVLAKSHSSELKRRFGHLEVLQYLLIDGAFYGAVCGHWRIGSHDVSDIIVTLAASERKRRRDEIVAAVAQRYHLPHSRILRYDGQELF